MPAQLCPACHRENPRLLEVSSKIAVMNFYACDFCNHVWTTSKTGEFVRHITREPEKPPDKAS